MAHFRAFGLSWGQEDGSACNEAEPLALRLRRTFKSTVRPWASRIGSSSGGGRSEWAQCPDGPSGGRTWSCRCCGWGALSGPAYYVYVTSRPVIGANIGAGFGLMWTAAWGWPWSLGPWNDVMIGLSSLDGLFLAFVACALLNVALVAAMFTGFYLYTARRLRKHAEPDLAPKRWHYAVVPLACLVAVVIGPIYFELQLSSGSLPTGAADTSPLTYVGPLSEQWNILLGLPWSQWPGALIGITESGLVNVALVSVAFLVAYLYKLRRAQLPSNPPARLAAKADDH